MSIKFIVISMLSKISQLSDDVLSFRQRSGRWVWSQESPTAFNVWAWARKSFKWTDKTQCKLRISSDLRYIAWLNGNRIGFGPPKHHAGTPTIDVYDLTGEIRCGMNTFVVQVYSLGRQQISSCMPQRGALWVIFENETEYVVSDSSWKMRLDPGYLQDVASRGEVQPPSEHYDARLGLGRPELEDFNDVLWPFAHELSGSHFEEMEERDIPFMTARHHAPDRIVERGVATFPQAYLDIPAQDRARSLACSQNLPDNQSQIRELNCKHYAVEFDANQLASNQSLYALFDFGRIWTGYPYILLKGEPGTVVDLSYSEDIKAHRIRPDKSIAYHDRITLGDSEFEHRITWPKCFRYLQLNVHGGRVEVKDLALERSSYPVVRNGFFSSNSPVIDQAVEISLHTVQLCMEDSYMDTPWRERGSWLGDDLIKAQTAYTYFQDYALARRFLIHHARGQNSDGMMRGKYPGNVTSDVSTWTLRFPPSVLEYCAESGDWDLGQELWPTLERIFCWLTSLQTSCNLFQAPPVHIDQHTNRYNFIDWAPIDMRGINSAWNAFAADCLRSLETIARMIGDKMKVQQISLLSSLHRTAFQKFLWDEKRGVFVNGLIEGSQTQRWGCQENYLAILYNLATTEQTTRIIERLRREDITKTFHASSENFDEELPGLGKIPTVSIARSKYRWPDNQMVPLGTAYFAGYMLEALCKCGLFIEAQQFIETRWGEFSRQGGTTVWETWNTDQSLSHGWSASPAVFAARHILGVQRADETGDIYHILPRIDDYTSLRGRVATRVGIVQVEWSENILCVNVPSGVRFFSGVPSGRLFLDGKIVSEPQIITKHGISYSVVELSAGSHRLERIALKVD
ncbi:MAG: hypothetical protein ACK5NG_00670 [Chthoniobacterales bacterium]